MIPMSETPWWAFEVIQEGGLMVEMNIFTVRLGMPGIRWSKRQSMLRSRTSLTAVVSEQSSGKCRMKDKIALCWSSGKDIAYALHVLRREGRYEVVLLLTTMTEGYDRVSMHGVRPELVLAQAAAAGLPLRIVWIPQQADNAIYEARMAEALAEFKSAGVGSIAFGDLFLEDLKKYREDKLAAAGMTAVFPIWKRDTRELARRMVAEGFRVVLTCVDTQKLDARFAGREYDLDLLADLPAGVDPCGENGEFHSFCCAGPIFSHPLDIRRGEVVLRDGRFNFCDVLAKEAWGVRRSA